MAKARLKTFKVAIVGGETLLGRELKEIVEARGLGATVAAYSATGEGNFGQEEGEAVYLEPLGPAAIREAGAILLAGSREGALKAFESRRSEGRAVLIDCTGELEDRPEARLVAPLIEEVKPSDGVLLTLAHPAAAAIALVLMRLAKYRPLRRAVVHVFEPASERGNRGVSELHQQTTGLLAFKPLEKKLFDAQLSFNLLAQWGEDAPGKLLNVEQRIERHLATLLSRQAPAAVLLMPSIRVIQAPVFHGYSVSLWVEFEGDIGAQAVGESLASSQIEVRGATVDAPDNVGAAGQSGLIAGDIRIDPNNPRAAWLWVVADNLRLMADGAADVVSALSSAGE